MSNEEITLYLGICSLIVALIGLVIALKTKSASWKIAERSGTFDRSELEASIGAFVLPNSGDISILMGSPSFNEDKPTIGILPITLASAGKKSLDDVSITFQYNNLFRRDLLQQKEDSANAVIGTSSLKRSMLKNGSRTFMTHTVSSLNPGVAVTIQEPIFIQRTTFTDKVTATTRDGFEVTIPFEARISLQFAATFTARDTPYRTFPVSISFCQASSLENLREEPLHQYISDRQKNFRERLTYSQYFFSILSRPTEAVCIIYSTTTECPTKKGTISSADDIPRAVLEKFQITSWNLLFKKA
jgi:hypothetical protein